MNKIKVSVIIPVYNAGEFLKGCLDSVINQTLKEIEIIIINDGSTDSSYSIIKEYALTDNRMVVVNQKNQGQGNARNNAIKLANGEYLAFADNDDLIKLNSLEVLYNEASKYNLDILEGRYQKIDINNTPGEIHPSRIKLTDIVISGVEYIQTYRERISTTLWDKLWKTSFVRNYNILNGENMHGAEDVMFSIGGFMNAKRVKNIDILIYSHREHPKAASNKADQKHVEGRIRMIAYLDEKNEEFVSNNQFDILKKDIVFHLVFTLRTIKKYHLKDDFRRKMALELTYYINKYKRFILSSPDYSIKEKILLSISIQFYLSYYDLKNSIGIS